MKKNSISDKAIAFFGTPEVGVYVLEELRDAGIIPSVIVTTPDKPAGRGMELKESPVKKWAKEHDIPVIQPATLSSSDPEADILYNGEWEVFVVAAYGKIIPENILKIPHSGTLNVHPSLLPKYRGPSPVISQILSDDRETGVSIMLLDNELDHGPIVAQASITPEEWPLKAGMLEELLSREGGKLLAEILPEWINDSEGIDNQRWEEGAEPSIRVEPQDHEKATYTKKVEKSDGLLNLDDNGYQNYLKYCAYDEWPGTYFFVRKNDKEMRVKITEAIFENNAFIVKRVIPEGKKEMDYESFLRGSK